MSVPPLDDFDNLLRRVLAETSFFPVPPEGFDPLTASAAQLAFFVLPELPNPRTDPGRYRFWRKFYSPPLRFIDAEFLPLVPNQRLRSAQLRRIAAATSRETSRNWSGAYISPRDGRMLTEVYGVWHVPAVFTPAGAPTGVEYRSSTWIGLDGQRRYLDSSLPQIGTQQFAEDVAGVQTLTTECWWQWWLRDHMNPSVPIPLPVAPGDEMMASMIVIDETHVRFYIKNVTSGGLSPKIFVKSAPQATLPDGSGVVQVEVSVEVSGATAEWVMERPTVWASEELHELPQYGTVEFFGCGAVSARNPGEPGRGETLVGARFINMQKVETDPSRTVTISVAERSGDHGVRMTYHA